ncbi:hypothetical protein [Halomicrococcus sp. SG-WS-1]|uniref:hypothetical protein n=1 Tax=Halomicrococcus sp. SG-WS-1 TaxID=3439057 RepID=UPI003F7A0CBA
MVEITRLADDGSASADGHALELDETAFETELAALLRRGDRDGVAFDRSWTVQCADGPALMVEVTRLATPDRVACTG